MDDPSPPASDPDMPKELRRWESIRRKGKARFILFTGVLGWGLTTFVIMTFLFNRKNQRMQSPEGIAGSAVIWALGGICFGWCIWGISEKKYLNYIGSRKGPDGH